MSVEFDYTSNGEEPECGRGPDGCSGEVFPRTSHSGLTRSFMCEGHARKLDETIRGIERRYPEVNHPEYCGCHGCTGDPYTDPFEAQS